MARTGHTPRTGIQPVILGGDIGVYALARSFHEAYRVTSVVVSTAPIRAITASRIAHTVPVDEPGGARAHIDALLKISEENRSDQRRAYRFAHGAAPHPDFSPQLLLMANTDWFIRLAVEHRSELENAGYIVPFLDLATLDQVSDKASFARVCHAEGVPTPRTVVVDFAQADRSDWQPPQVDIDVPLVAKPSSSAAYNEVRFAGKKKVYHLTGPREVPELIERLRAAGFRDRFLFQELIPGDDTYMRSITAYVDTRGVVSLLGSAHVLLEDHAPSMLGNPVAMITGRDDELTEPARRFLAATNYRGFANFDVKIDPRNGRAMFFEVNPRIGRNSYYMTAGGLNPMRWLVEDVIDHEPAEPRILEREILYSLVPNRLLKRYLVERELRERVAKLIERGKVTDPLNYGNDVSPVRWGAIRATRLNQYRKFARYYPKPTRSSF